KENAARLELSIDFQRADIFPAHISGAPLDLVVSNPPYLDFARDKITKEVREWEPKIALEPVARNRISLLEDRATWCAERILLACAGEEVRFTAMELSPRVARALELRWRKNSMVER